MSIFNFKEKKEVRQTCGCQGEETTDVSAVGMNVSQREIHGIKVLGAGCKSCHEQYENAKKAVSEMGLDIEIEYITDMEKVMSYGVMSLPAIVVNGKVVSAGKVLKAADVAKMLSK